MFLEITDRLRTPNEDFFQWYPTLLGLGRQIGLINFGAFGIFSTDLSALFWHWFHCPWDLGVFPTIFVLFSGLTHIYPKYTPNMILAVKNLGNSHQTSVIGAWNYQIYQTILWELGKTCHLLSCADFSKECFSSFLPSKLRCW